MEQKVFAKVAWRLVPFMMLLYVANFLDRVNVGFAALTMNRDLASARRRSAPRAASFSSAISSSKCRRT
ncbi:MAG TPA: hypothetical protein VHZ29_14370 [Rhizomicrobium sp.]|nr:hypothetical protein [Rhizomicrobium sp.]